MTDMTIAKTILEQLGGRQFLSMTGAKNLTGGEYTLSMSLPRMSGLKVNKVVVTLTPADTYKVDFYWMNRRAKNPLRLVSSVEDVYAEMLEDVFETETGLFTSLSGRSRF